MSMTGIIGIGLIEPIVGDSDQRSGRSTNVTKFVNFAITTDPSIGLRFITLSQFDSSEMSMNWSSRTPIASGT
jgi:hypothetical protein